MVFHHKNPNQRKGGHVKKKVLKKGKRGNKKERLLVYNEVDYFFSCLKNGKKPKNDENSALEVMRFIERIKNAMDA